MIISIVNRYRCLIWTNWGKTSGFHYCVWRRSTFPCGKHCDYSGLLHCVADGELYAGTVSNFQGNEPIIYKSLSQGTALKTENSLNWLQGTIGRQYFLLNCHLIKKYIILYHILYKIKDILKLFMPDMLHANSIWHHSRLYRWKVSLSQLNFPFSVLMSEEIRTSVPRRLNFIYCRLTWVTFLSDPAFVGSAYIQESLPKGNLVGDDDKIYFFFSEAGKEFDFFDNTIVSRIARVCKVSDAWREIVHLKGPFPPLAIHPDTPSHYYRDLSDQGEGLFVCLCISCVFIDSTCSDTEAHSRILLKASYSLTMMSVAYSLSLQWRRISCYRKTFLLPVSLFVLFLQILSSLKSYHVSAKYLCSDRTL